MMNRLNIETPIASLEGIAFEVAQILKGQMEPKDLLKLLEVVFLTVEEAAKLLRVEKRTIYQWISQDRIPTRHANGKPVFLLRELMKWTLPENDKHEKSRLPVAAQCNIATSRLAAIRERVSKPCQ